MLQSSFTTSSVPVRMTTRRLKTATDLLALAREPMLWEASGNYRRHNIDPIWGKLSGPCGLIAPSRNHEDAVPRNQEDTWENPMNPVLANDPSFYSHQHRGNPRERQRSRSPAQRKMYSQSSDSAPWRSEGSTIL